MYLEAARAIARAEHIPAPERHELMAMLGLLDETGRAIAPDPDPDEWQVGGTLTDRGGRDIRGGKSNFAKAYDEPPAPRDHLPAGLRLTPAERDQLTPKPTAPPKPPKPVRQLDPETGLRTYFPRPNARRKDVLPPTIDETCGSLTGRNHHVRRGEALCDACRDYYNSYQRAKKAAARVGKPSRANEAQCGTASGARRHARLGEEVCPACLEARRAAGRAHWYRREARRKAAEAQGEQVAS